MDHFDIFLWLVTCVLIGAGHVSAAVWALNVCYGQPWPKPLLRRLRKLHLAWVLLGTPVLLAFFSWLWFTDAQQLLVHPVGWYAAACVAVALAAFLPAQVARWLRCRPSCQRSNHTHVVSLVDDPTELPVARGPKWRFAFVPGNQQFELEVTCKELALERLPAELDGLTILHLSDWHFSGVLTKDFYRRVVAEAVRLGTPDLAVLTGDYIDNPVCYPWISELLEPIEARWGCYAVVGNHDNWFDVKRIRQELAKAGFRRAKPEGELLRIGDEAEIFIAGTEWPWIGELPVRAPASTFSLLLSHGPDVAYEAASRGYDLLLCGHNHGGQVRLPVIGPVYMPSRYGRRFDMGVFEIGRMVMFVHKGIGGEHPLRIGARPEIVWLTLRAAVVESGARTRETDRAVAAVCHVAGRANDGPGSQLSRGTA